MVYQANLLKPRFKQRDPSGESSGLNLYAYCADNPICNVDPSGLDFVPAPNDPDFIIDPSIFTDPDSDYSCIDDLEDNPFDPDNFDSNFDDYDWTGGNPFASPDPLSDSNFDDYTYPSADAINAADYARWWEIFNANNQGLQSGTVLDLFSFLLGGSRALAFGVAATKSSLTLGNQVHALYKLGLQDGINTFKEYRQIPGIRPDFVDFNTKTIYELKPNNPRGIADGLRQLSKYQSIFNQKFGPGWKTVLDTY